MACYGHLFLSTDNAVTFPLQPALPSADVGRMTLAAAASDRANPLNAYVYLLAATANCGAQADVFLSRTGGGTWQSFFHAISMSAVPCPSQ